MKYNLQDLLIKGQDLEEATQINKAFFKYNGLTRCLKWTQEFTKSIPRFPKPLQILGLIYSIIIIASLIVRFYLLKALDTFTDRQLLLIKIAPILAIPLGIFLLLLSLIIVITLLIFIISFLICIVQAIWFQLTRYRSIKGILAETKNYNQLIVDFYQKDKSMDTNLKTEKLQDKQRIVEALYLTRLDLIRALQVEKKIWEQKKKSQYQPENTMFVNSLDALESLRLREENSEYKAFLDKALQLINNLETVISKQ